MNANAIHRLQHTLVLNTIDFARRLGCCPGKVYLWKKGLDEPRSAELEKAENLARQLHTEPRRALRLNTIDFARRLGCCPGKVYLWEEGAEDRQVETRVEEYISGQNNEDLKNRDGTVWLRAS